MILGPNIIESTALLKQANLITCTIKILNTGTPKFITMTVLKIKQFVSSIQQSVNNADGMAKHVNPDQMKEQSELVLHHLLKSACPNN